MCEVKNGCTCGNEYCLDDDIFKIDADNDYIKYIFETETEDDEDVPVLETKVLVPEDKE